MGKQLNYFVRANSSKGLVNLLPSNVAGLSICIILNGPFEKIKFELLSLVSKYVYDHNYDYECIHSCLEPDALEGIIIRDLQIGIFSNILLNASVLKLFENVITIDLNAVMHDEYAEIKEYLLEYKDELQLEYDNAYKFFANAIKIHDDWEKIYINNMNYKLADSFSEDLIQEIFASAKKHSPGNTYHRFFGGATYKGAVDYVCDLTKNITNRYFIKGRPGTGKSTLLKKIQAKAESLGMNVEVYHCGFDPDSLDMILIRQLDFCIFDSTSPHEYFPIKNTDRIVDMYAACVKPDTDEKYKDQLNEIGAKYKAMIVAGTSHLQHAKAINERMNLDINMYMDINVLECKFILIKELLNLE